MYTGLNSRYKFNTIHQISKMTLSKAILKIEPMFDNLETKYLSGLYSVRVGNEIFVYSQIPELDPPKFGVTKPTNSKLKTSSLGIVIKSDSEYLQNYYIQIERARNLIRT